MFRGRVRLRSSKITTNPPETTLTSMELRVILAYILRGSIRLDVAQISARSLMDLDAVEQAVQGLVKQGYLIEGAGELYILQVDRVREL